MTTNDYLKAATIIRNMKSPTELVPIQEDLQLTDSITVQTAVNASAWCVRECFVQLFAADNPLFDPDKFREACKRSE